MKTQTRRVVKPQPPTECSIHYMLGSESWLAPGARSPLRHSWEAWHGPLYENRPAGHLAGSHDVKCPYGAVGDRLWVREAFHYERSQGLGDGGRVWYVADGFDFQSAIQWGPRRSPLFMPRWASRITLEITDARVQRLQSISEADACAEGVRPLEVGGEKGVSPAEWSHIEGYARLWDTINAKRAPWASNPWVWTISFKRADAAA